MPLLARGFCLKWPILEGVFPWAHIFLPMWSALVACIWANVARLSRLFLGGGCLYLWSSSLQLLVEVVHADFPLIKGQRDMAGSWGYERVWLERAKCGVGPTCSLQSFGERWSWWPYPYPPLFPTEQSRCFVRSWSINLEYALAVLALQYFVGRWPSCLRRRWPIPYRALLLAWACFLSHIFDGKLLEQAMVLGLLGRFDRTLPYEAFSSSPRCNFFLCQTHGYTFWQITTF